MERIASGFSLAEAPVVTTDGVVLVSDVLGGGVRRFDADGRELEPLLERRRGIGGMGQRADGSVVVSGRDLSLVAPDGGLVVLSEALDGGTGYNDLVIAADDSILAGMLTCQPFSGDDLTPGVLVAVAADGSRSSAPLPFCWPNGIGFSPGGDLLYFADYASGVVYRSAWTGHVSELELQPWITSPTGDADGLAVDDDGQVWVAGGTGRNILRYEPTGALAGEVEVPDDFVSSCCFWPGRHRLVITTGTGVFVHDL